MNKFFNLKFSYLTENNEGETQTKRHQVLIEGINYQDAEQSAIRFFDYFHLGKIEKPIYEISKINVQILLIGSEKIVTEFDGSEMNDLVMLHSTENDFTKSSDTVGIYKADMCFLNLEGKVKKQALHIFATNINNAFSICKLFANNFLDKNAYIQGVKLEKFECALLTKERVYDSSIDRLQS